MMALACWTLRINVSKQTIILLLHSSDTSAVSATSLSKKKKQQQGSNPCKGILYLYVQQQKI